MNARVVCRTGRPRRDKAGKLRPGKRTYMVLVYVDRAHGGPRRESAGTFDLEREARAARDKLLRSFAEGTWRPASPLTVAELCERFLSEHAAGLRPLSEKNYRRVCEHKIVPYLGTERADTLTPARISAWLTDLARDGRGDGRGGMAPKYVRQCRFVLHRAYAFLVGMGELPRNPVDAVPGPAVPHRDAAPPSVPHMRVTLDALQGTRYHIPAAIAAATGLRRGEVLGLDWTLADLDSGVVHVRRQLVDSADGPVLASLKTLAAYRDLEMPGFLLAILFAERRRQQAQATVRGQKWTPHAFVCQAADGGPVPPDYFSRGFTGILRRRGLPVFRFHDLRHAFATSLLEEGERPDVVARLLGHAGVGVLLGIYAHVRPGETAKALARYDRQWRATGEPERTPVSGRGQQTGPNLAPADELAARRRRKSSA